MQNEVTIIAGGNVHVLELTDEIRATLVDRQLYRANLDADQVFWGVTEIHADDVHEGDLILDHVPDNRPGVYRWDAAHQPSPAFVPLPLSQQKEEQTVPSLDRMLYDFFNSYPEPLPKSVHEWLEYQKTTVDSRPG